MAREAASGIDLVNRINLAADRTTGLQRVEDSALRAIFVVAERRRQTLGRHRAA